MKKVMFAFAIAMLSFSAVNAQSSDGGFHFGGGVKVALPIGDMADIWNLGIGAELQGEYLFSEKFSGLISAGYTSFSGKTISGFKMPALNVIPVMAGIRVYPSNSFFIGAKAGVSIGTGSGSGSIFTYEPQIGLNGEKFQVALGYNAMSDEGTLGSIGLTGIFKFN